MFLRLTIILFHLMCFVSCKQAKQPQAQNQSLGISVDDSTAISQGFQKAPFMDSAAYQQLKDSLWILVKQDPQNQFWYDLNRLKADLLKADTSIIDTLHHKISAYENDTLNIQLAYYYNLLGSYCVYKAKLEESIKYFEKAARIFSYHGNQRQLGVIYFNLVNVFFIKLEYNVAYDYSSKAKNIFKQLNDTFYMPLSAAMNAVSALGVLDKQESLVAAEEALDLSHRYQNKMAEVFALFALAENALNRNDVKSALLHYKASDDLGKAIGIRNLELPTMAGLVRAYFEDRQYEKAIEEGKQAILAAEKQNTDNLLYSLHRHVAFSFEGIGKMSEAYKHLKIAESIFRSNQEKNNDVVMKELLVKYEDELKTNTILKQQNVLSTQKAWLLGLVILVGLGIIAILWRISILKQKRSVERANYQNNLLKAVFSGEEKERKRLASELHNGIASNLVAIKLQLENFDGDSSAQAQLSKALSIVTKTHAETRHIAHNLLPVDFKQQSLNDVILQFCESCSTPSVQVNFTSNGEPLVLAETSSMVLYRSLQECVQNALKHANSTRVDVQLMVHKDKVRLSVEDNGIGFSLNDGMHVYSGLQEMKQRLESVDMEFNIDSEPGKGASIFINFNTTSL